MSSGEIQEFLAMRLAIITFVLLFLGCSGPVEKKPAFPDQGSTGSDLIPFNADSIEIEGDLNGFTLALHSEKIEDGVEVIKIRLNRETPAAPPPFQLKWKFPSVNIQKYWNPRSSVDRVNYYDNSITSSSTRFAPVLSFMDVNDLNRFTFAVGDALNKIGLYSELIEEDANFHCAVSFFEEQYPAISNYETEIIIDRRPAPFYTSLKRVTDWWAAQDNYTPMPAPEAARRPMYSTWYSYHQNLDAEKIIHECREARKIGMEAVIVDDGWQTLDNQRGYAYTGDWNPDRIPNMKAFVDSIHALDMNFLLWYSVPLVGKNAKNFARFKGKYLYEWTSQGCFVLDPRYPDVREFIICTYETAQSEWNLDGFKLDFMGFFRPGENTQLTAEDGRDFASVNDAVDRLMTDIMERLKTQNPDIMIEFRQPYIGPLMRKYGNMLRATDCPNMSVVNKVRVTDIRLLGGSSAVHSDMLMWHYDDPVEQAALQIQNILFSVPQISVRLDEVPAEHKQMITFWIDYWNKNRDVLIHGEFKPQAPDALYPVITSSTNAKSITALYQDVYIKNDFDTPPKAIDIVNARRKTDVLLFNGKDYGFYKYRIFDSVGRQTGEGKLRLKKGAIAVAIPPAGLLQLLKTGR